MTSEPTKTSPPSIVEYAASANAGDPTPSLVWGISPKIARILALTLFLLGIEAWLNLGRGEYGHRYQVLILPAAILCGLIPPIRKLFNSIWLAINKPSLSGRIIIALLLSAGSAFYLYLTASNEGIPLYLKYQDEFSYLLQARMLAQGTLHLPPHPLADFFDTIYVLGHPVYVSMYFPGTALMYLPVIWLHLPPFIAPLIVMGICIGLFYLIVAEILDGPSALIAVLVLLTMTRFRMLSIMFMSQPPALCLGLVMTYAFLQWRKSRNLGLAAVGGAAAGWAAITRPADALCFAIVLLIPAIMELKSRQEGAIKSIAIAILAASPFLGLQLKFNHDVTGEFTKSPFTFYTEQFYPGIGFGFGEAVPAGRHVSDLPQKQLLYDRFTSQFLTQHRWIDIPQLFLRRLEFVVDDGTLDPIAFVWLILPLSLLALWNRQLWTVWGMLLVFPLIYTGYAFILPHYLLSVFPAVAFLVVLPIRSLTDIFPRQKAMWRTMIGLGIIGVSIVALPQFDRVMLDQRFNAWELGVINQNIAKDVKAPAVVLFHFNQNKMIDGRIQTDTIEVEPVYNADVAWPDDAPIIRAHDLNVDVSAIGKPGDKDRPLYLYYEHLDPQREIYLYDRRIGQGHPVRLGTAGELAEKTR